MLIALALATAAPARRAGTARAAGSGCSEGPDSGGHTDRRCAVARGGNPGKARPDRISI